MIEIKRTDSLAMVLDKLKQHTYVAVYTANVTNVHVPVGGLEGFDSCFFTCTFEHDKLTEMSTGDIMYRGTLGKLVDSIMLSISMCELGDDSGYVNMIIHYPESDNDEHMYMAIYEPNDNCNDDNN